MSALDEYVPAMEDLLRRNGYRFVVDRVSHVRTVRRGGEFEFSSTGVTWA